MLAKRLENQAPGAISKNSARRGTAAAMGGYVGPTTNARRRIMTATLTPTSQKAPLTRDEVKKMLRDAAYVLHLTRRVKAEIVAERPEAARSPVHSRRLELAAGLGV
jgi:hypothetical protein